MGKESGLKFQKNLDILNQSPNSPPSEELARNKINNLPEEFDKFDLSEYISLHEGKTYAMFKYANDALRKILKIKSEERKMVKFRQT